MNNSCKTSLFFAKSEKASPPKVFAAITSVLGTVTSSNESEAVP